ncbi:ABC transporter substrate-binding protein [Microbacteriaceae bacterium K1510]|nr:ABC transporter substrate-binding protein [Microbacteriaceae bacterium K1510]
MMKLMRWAGLMAGAAMLSAVQAASAEDTVKLAVGQRGNWDTSVSEIGQQAGIFKKHGLVLEMVYTQGAGETQQAVISGSVDLGIAAGVMGVLGAYSKGAPVRIMSAETTGAGDLYWYVKADSPIKSLKDTGGKTLAYSTNGSSTHGVVTAFIKKNNLTAKPVAMGGPAANITAVMSGQIDVGWAAPPFGLDQLDSKQIRMIATGNDAKAFAGQTVRLNIVNANYLKEHADIVNRYMKAYRETVDFMYKDPKALEIYAAWLKIPVEKAKRTRDEFFKPPAIEPDKIVGLDTIVKDAVVLKFTASELTGDQLKDLIRIPPR